MGIAFCVSSYNRSGMHPAIKLRHLRAFLDIAAEENLSAVARRHGISQPALSRTLSELEDLLGTALFERAGRRLVGDAPATELIAADVRPRADAARAAARVAGRAGSEAAVSPPRGGVGSGSQEGVRRGGRGS